jgi:hypothetical protein
MPQDQSQGPICQSCAMPLSQPEDFGTASGGLRISDYCRYCFADGAFTNPGITLPQMVDLCRGILVQRGMPQTQAQALMRDTLPRLKRWRSGVSVVV